MNLVRTHTAKPRRDGNSAALPKNLWFQRCFIFVGDICYAL